MSFVYVLARFVPSPLRRNRFGREASAPRAWARLSMTILEDRLAPAVLTVNSLADGPISAAGAGLTLRDAIVLIDTGGTATDASGNSLAADNASQIDTAAPFGVDDAIQFAPSLFGSGQPQIVLDAGGLMLDRNAVISGPGQSELAVSGNNQSTVFEVAAGADVSISGLTIEAGAATGNSGGGIISGGTLTLIDTVVTGNSAAAGGGGILNTGTLTLINSAVSGNTALNNGGLDNFGALTLIDSSVSGNTAILANGGLANYGGTMTLIDSAVSGNTAQVVGGLGNYLGGTATLLNSVVSGNSASTGAGGIYNSAALTLTDSTVFHNSAGQGNDGGIFNNGTLTLANSVVSANTALNDGGINNDGTLTLIDSQVSGNSALDGNGGVANYGGTMTLIDTTISGNTASGAGGLGNYDNGTATLLDTTVSGNSAGFAGGILNAANLTLTDSTVADNTALQGNGGGIFNTASLTLVNSTASGNTARTDGDLDNSGVLTLVDHSASGNNAIAGNGGTPALIDRADSDGPSSHRGDAAEMGSGSLPSFAGSILDNVPLARTDGTVSESTAVQGNSATTWNPSPPALAKDPGLESMAFIDAGAVAAETTAIGVDHGAICARIVGEAQAVAESPATIDVVARFLAMQAHAAQELMSVLGQSMLAGRWANPTLDATSNAEETGAEWFDFRRLEGLPDPARHQGRRKTEDRSGLHLMLPLLTTGGFLLEEHLAQLKESLKDPEDGRDNENVWRRRNCGIS